MVNEQSRSSALVRVAKRPLVLFLIAAALLALLAYSERSGDTSFTGSDIAARSARQTYRSNFGSQAATPAQAVQLPGSTAPAASGAAGASADQALGTAQNAANQAVAQASNAAAAAVAAQQFPPFVSAVVCPILLQARAQVIATINALEQAFPFLTPQLEAIKASALATIDAQIAEFGCNLSV